QRAAELVALERRDRRGRVLEKGGGGGPALAGAVEGGGGKNVCGRAGEGERDGARAGAGLGAAGVGASLGPARRGPAQRAAGGAARRPVPLRVHVGAVHLEADLVRPRTRDRHLRAHAAIDRLRGGRGRRDAELEQRQLAEVAPVQRELADLALIDESG